MEVMVQHHMEEVEATEEPSVLVERWKTRRPENTKGFHSDQSVYLDDINGENNLKAEGLESLDISKLVNAAINDQSAGNDLVEIVVSATNKSTWKVENLSSIVGATEEAVRIDIVEESENEESENEEIELEFERAVDKIHTHTAHCPNCKREITKVVLRRRNRNLKRPASPDSKPGDNDDKPLDLFGCLSCFRIFFPSGNLPNLSRIFGPKGSSINPNLPAPAGSTGGNLDLTVKPGASPDHAETTAKPETNEPTTDGIKSPEILKCIVYGGLLESMASLSVVSSAAASDANTLNIIALGLANVIGGLFVIAQNLVDLKNEDSGGISNQETHRYKELLGRRKHFSLHATLAILSFLVFGLIPPIVYGFAFRVSNNKDYKILAVAASSLASIIILATAKTYAKGPSEKFSSYIKTILYYCTMAFGVSGVSYAAGDLIKILVQKLGWFEPSPGAGAASSFIANMNPATPAWAYN